MEFSFVSQIIHLPFARRMEGFMPCRGDVLKLAEYETLFAILSWRFGGSGSNFAIPDLRPFAKAGGPDFGELSRREWNETDIVPHICVRGEFPQFSD